MNSTASTPGQGEGLPDDLDRLLRAYFRSEVPSPWPGAPTPATVQPAAAPLSNRLAHSRLVLAASIAALLVGGWLLTGKSLGPANSAVSLHEGAAKVPADLRPDSGMRGR